MVSEIYDYQLNYTNPYVTRDSAYNGNVYSCWNSGNIDAVTTDQWKIRGFTYIDYILRGFAANRLVNLYIGDSLVDSAGNTKTVSYYPITAAAHTIKIEAQYPGSGQHRYSGFTPHN